MTVWNITHEEAQMIGVSAQKASDFLLAAAKAVAVVEARNDGSMFTLEGPTFVDDCYTGTLFVTKIV